MIRMPAFIRMRKDCFDLPVSHEPAQTSREFRKAKARLLIGDRKENALGGGYSGHMQCAAQLFLAASPIVIQSCKAVGTAVLLIARCAVGYMHKQC
jgi:hypothetical protein